MANAFKQKQETEKLKKLLADCVQLAENGVAGRRRAIEAYAKGSGVSLQVAEQVLSDRRRISQINFNKMFEPR